MTFRDADTTPKELFVNHQAGLGGTDIQLGLDAVILRDKDEDTAWTTAADGILEARSYLLQDLRAGRADTLQVVKDTGVATRDR